MNEVMYPADAVGLRVSEPALAGGRLVAGSEVPIVL